MDLDKFHQCTAAITPPPPPIARIRHAKREISLNTIPNKYTLKLLRYTWLLNVNAQKYKAIQLIKQKKSRKTVH